MEDEKNVLIEAIISLIIAAQKIEEIIKQVDETIGDKNASKNNSYRKD